MMYDPHQRKKHILDIFGHALGAVEPGKAIRRWVKRKGNKLLASTGTMSETGVVEYDLDTYSRCIVTGCGKAGAPMFMAVEDLLGDFIHEGIVTVKYGHTGGFSPKHVVFFEAAHPVPDNAGIRAASEASKAGFIWVLNPFALVMVGILP
jgi:glycerate 2-kinase